MSVSRPVLSVLVPTRNRAKYAVRMIDSILNLTSREFELVIGDNSDDDQLESYAKKWASDDRLNYQRVPGVLSMTENHNLVFSRARGNYIILIGDDDTILPSAIEAAKWATEKGWEAVTPTAIPSYVWPDARHWFFGGGLAGKSYFLPFSGKIKKADAQVALNECLEHAGQGVRNLPKIYHGIVRRDCFEIIREKTGTYFKGASPDVYGALALGVILTNYCHLDYPLSIAGIGGGSNSGRAAQKQHKGEIKTDPHMKAFSGLMWPSEIPDFFSVETVWAEASLEAIRAFDLDVSRYNFDYLYAKCLVAHPKEFRRILIHYFSSESQGTVRDANFLKLLKSLSIIMLKELIHLSYRALRPTRRGWQREIPGGENICIASQKFQEFTYSDRSKSPFGST